VFKPFGTQTLQNKGNFKAGVKYYLFRMSVQEICSEDGMIPPNFFIFAGCNGYRWS
jgi:hypothetical protein